MRNLYLLLGTALALSSCAQVSTSDIRACAGALVASPLVVDLASAQAVALTTPACAALTADLLRAALTQALAAKGH